VSWKVEKGKDGLPVWRGVDEIRDMWHYVAETGWAFGKIASGALAFALFIGGLAALAPLGDMFTPRGVGWWVRSMGVGTFALVTLLGFVCLAGSVGAALLTALEKPSGWITRRWSLTASASRLVYEASRFSAPLDPLQVTRDGSRWSVPLDAVSRVEAGRSVEWQAVRVYEGKPFDSRDGVAKIPDNEYQTFLFMADGSRRVIYTGNADREGAGMLAQCIGAWIEARRNEAKSKTASPAALVAAGEEGFDL
jgi:hypothetical protein